MNVSNWGHHENECIEQEDPGARGSMHTSKTVMHVLLHIHSVGSINKDKKKKCKETNRIKDVQVLMGTLFFCIHS